MTTIPTNSKKYNLDFTLKLHNKFMKLNDMDVVNKKTSLDKNVNDYYINSLEFRDKKNWVAGEPADIVALGCSHTYGIGVPQEYTWPSIIESKTNKTVANLGICGASTQKIMESFLFYLDKVGTPKYLFACFPDHLRYSHVVEGNIFPVVDSQGENLKSRKVVTHTRTSDYLNGNINIENKIIKLPADPQHLISIEECISQYISSIYIIEKLCKFLNIKFYWGTWHDSTRSIFEDQLFLQENFCLSSGNFINTIKSNLLANLSLNLVEYQDEINCESKHEMILKDFKKYESMWSIGSDHKHLGIHWQQHTADNFIRKIKEDQ